MRTLTVALSELKTATYKARDAWWTVLLVDPFAVRVLRALLPLRWVTPNRVTVGAFGLGLISAGFFALGDTAWLIVGAIFYHLAFVLDCVDGKLARWRNTSSPFGSWLDVALDRLRVLVCTIGLMGGQYAQTGRAVYLYLGLGIVFLDVFRQWNGLLIFRARLEMRQKIDATVGGNGPAVVFHDEAKRDEAVPDVVDEEDGVVDLQQQFRSRYRGFMRVRNWLVSHRIRPHVISGIEFQMAVFIVAPVTGLILSIPFAIGVVFVLFELAIMYKFWLSTLDFNRALAAVEAAASDRDVPAQRSTQAAQVG